MNSSITPLSAVGAVRTAPALAQLGRGPRARHDQGQLSVRADPKRIIQDPESMRASSIRQASAWEEWAALRDAVSSRPTRRTTIRRSRRSRPGDSWELATPQMMRFYVKGGPLSHGQHGYIVSNANWDPYPMANAREFHIALANMDVAVMLRIERFRNTVLYRRPAARSVLPGFVRTISGYMPRTCNRRSRASRSRSRHGQRARATVEDLQAQTRLKAQRARQAVDDAGPAGARPAGAGPWLDVRGPRTRSALRVRTDGGLARAARVDSADAGPGRPHTESDRTLAAAFIRTHPAAAFYSGATPLEARGN